MMPEVISLPALVITEVTVEAGASEAMPDFVMNVEGNVRLERLVTNGAAAEDRFVRDGLGT